jgi:hypothetical protein
MSRRTFSEELVEERSTRGDRECSTSGRKEIPNWIGDRHWSSEKTPAVPVEALSKQRSVSDEDQVIGIGELNIGLHSHHRTPGHARGGEHERVMAIRPPDDI